jgi:N6-L-threonylcarbamoyladenine synthase
MADIAYAVQEAIVETLVAKSLRALDATGLDTLVVSGGVGANKRLRARMSAAVAARGGSVFYPRFEFCTDNAAMVAVAGMQRLKAGQVASLAIEARAQWPLDELAAL